MTVHPEVHIIRRMKVLLWAEFQRRIAVQRKPQFRVDVAVLLSSAMLCLSGQAALIRQYTFDSDVSDSAGGYHGSLVDVGVIGNSGVSTNAGEFIVGSGTLNLSKDRDYVDVPLQIFPSGKPYSIAFWARKAAAGTGWHMVLGLRSDVPHFIGLLGSIGIRRRGSDSSAARKSDFAAPDDTEWHHYVITASASGTVRCYLDGEFAGAETGELTGYVYDTIGEAFPDSRDNDFHGQIDDVHVYDEQIDSELVTELYTRGAVAPPDRVDHDVSLIRRYTFDSDFSDSAGNNHGSLVDVGVIGNSGIRTNAGEFIVGNGALDLSEERDYVSIPSQSFPSGSPYSIAFWAKKAVADANWNMVIGRRSDIPHSIGLLGGIGIRRRGSDASDTRKSTFAAPDDTKWHHYVITASEHGVLRCYVDGEFAGLESGELTGYIFDTVGESYPDTYNYDFHGQIDDVHVYNEQIDHDKVMWLCSRGAVARPPPVNYDVDLIGGQSNADGRGVTSDLTGELSGWNAPQHDVRIYYVNPGSSTDPANPEFNTGWTALTAGWSVPPADRPVLPSGRFGLELSFARVMADSAPDRRVALIKVTKGGTNLRTDWNPGESGNFMWQTFTNFVPRALQTLTNAQDTVTLKGMIWHQGEADGANPDFKDDLKLLLNAIRTFVGNPEFPIVQGELAGKTATPDYHYQNRAMAEVRDRDPFTGLASSDSLPASDGTHFDTSALITYGVRYANLIQNVDDDELPDDWERLMLASITNSSGSAREDWDGDGSSDHDEFMAGTHPAQAADVLRIAGMAPHSGELRWSSVMGRTYRVLHRTSWTNHWTTLRDNVPATPPENTEILPVTASPFDLYRIELVSP